MRVERRDGSKERTIITAMIVDKVVLGRVASKWDKFGLFKSKWTNLVAEWCIKYHNRHKTAPGKIIKSLYDSWAEDSNDEESIDMVKRYLQSLDDDYRTLRKESNSEYVLDMADAYFNEVRVLRLSEALQGDLNSQDLEKAIKRIHSFGKVAMNQSSFINVLQNKAAVKEAFTTKGEPLVVYPGPLGELLNPLLQRDAFVAFMGPEKRGKTWWLMDIAWMAMMQGRRVAFFEVGDMSQHQMEYRWGSRAAKHPIDPCKAMYPKCIVRDPSADFATVTAIQKEYKNKLSWIKAWNAFRSINKKSKGQCFLKLACFPNSSISALGISAELQGLERSGWVPDVVVIDYADILAPINGSVETREQINATWKALRAMSQTYHNLVVTATQSNAESYKTDMIDMTNFSEDKRKFGHVTAMLGLNQTKSEKGEGIIRINPVVVRGKKFRTEQFVHVAGCLELGRPAICSTY